MVTLHGYAIKVRSVSSYSLSSETITIIASK